MGARPLGRRLERGLGCSACGSDGAGGDRNGHGRLAPHPVGSLRHVGDQADARARLASRCRPAGGQPRPRRPDGAQPGRLRSAPHRHGRPGPGAPAEWARAGSAGGASRATQRTAAARRHSRGPVAADRIGRAGSGRRGAVRGRTRSMWQPRGRAGRGARAGRAARCPGTTSSTCCARSCSRTNRRFDGQRDRYRPSIREWVEEGERRARARRRRTSPPRRAGGKQRPAGLRGCATIGLTRSPSPPFPSPLRCGATGTSTPAATTR